MTRVSQPKTKGLKASYAVAPDAPIRAWDRPKPLPRDIYEAVRLGITLDELYASRTRILASDAREGGR